MTWAEQGALFEKEALRLELMPESVGAASAAATMWAMAMGLFARAAGELPLCPERARLLHLAENAARHAATCFDRLANELFHHADRAAKAPPGELH